MARREIGSFTPEQTQIIWDIVKQTMAADALRNKRRPADVNEPGVHRVAFRNDSGEEIPPFACLEVTGTTEDLDRTFVTVTKPTSICGEYIFNSQFAVEADKWGWAYAFGVVRMRGTASTYSSCKRYKPTIGSWDVSEGPGPFLVYGEDTSIDGSIRGRIVGDHCKARWIQFAYEAGGSNNTVTVDDFWDGPDPTSCGTVNVEYPLGEPCNDCDVIAFYDANSDTYQAIATPAAMMGDTSSITVLKGGQTTADPPEEKFAFTGCALGYTTQAIKAVVCDGVAESSETTEIGTIPVSIVQDVYLGSTGIIIRHNVAYVCGFASAHESEIPVYPCPVDPAPDCSGTTNWVWSYDDQAWKNPSPCPSGCVSDPPALPSAVNRADPGYDGTVDSQPCITPS